MQLKRDESLKNHLVIVDAFIHEKAKLTRRELLDRVQNVTHIRTEVSRSWLSVTISNLDQYLHWKKFHDLVNIGKFDFTGRHVFAVAVPPKLFEWFKRTSFGTIEKQITLWLAGNYYFNPEDRLMFEERLYPPLYDQILELIGKFFKDYELVDTLKLLNESIENNDEAGFKSLSREVEKATSYYLEACKKFYDCEPPEFLLSPLEYSSIEGWGLTETSIPTGRCSFDIVFAYFRQDDWIRIIEKDDDDSLNRTESRDDLWTKWKHTFGTYDVKKDFVYSYYFSSGSASISDWGKGEQITTNHGYVYLMRDNRNGLYKIGHSKDAKYREKTLQSEVPEISLIQFWVAPREKEKFLHKKYFDKRQRGEWFKLSEIDIIEIEQLMSLQSDVRTD